jgi:hypothetical protein
MLRPRLLCKPSSEATRLYLTYGESELLRAVLPPPGAQHPTAAPTLLEGLSLWLQRPLSVVLCADAEETSSALGYAVAAHAHRWRCEQPRCCPSRRERGARNGVMENARRPAAGPEAAAAGGAAAITGSARAHHGRRRAGGGPALRACASSGPPPAGTRSRSGRGRASHRWPPRAASRPRRG